MVVGKALQEEGRDNLNSKKAKNGHPNESVQQKRIYLEPIEGEGDPVLGEGGRRGSIVIAAEKTEKKNSRALLLAKLGTGLSQSAE